uniref:Podocin n=1 Tax=Esox lucius TaxID=8010 RepID=A0A3P8YT42_ESOLU
MRFLHTCTQVQTETFLSYTTRSMEMEHQMKSGMKRGATIRDDLILEQYTEDLGCCGWFAVIMCGIWTFCNFSWAFWFVVKIVVILKLGHITSQKCKRPDIFFTKDSVTVCVDGVVYFRVSDPIFPVTSASNGHYSVHLLPQTSLRNVLETKNHADLLSDHENISNSMQSNMDEATDPWGIKVERVEIKDVKLPQQLQRAMAAEAEAS